MKLRKKKGKKNRTKEKEKREGKWKMEEKGEERERGRKQAATMSPVPYQVPFYCHTLSDLDTKEIIVTQLIPVL